MKPQDELPTPEAVALEGVSKSFEDVTALDAVDLVLPEASVTALVGAPGAGKTTLLRVLAGLEVAEQGIVRVAGAEVAGPGGWVPPHARRLGWAGAGEDLFTHLDVAGNIGYGVARGDRRARVERMLTKVGLNGSGRRRVTSLTPDERRMVAWARAVAPRPQAVLLDEPLARVESSRPAALRTLLELLRDEGTTALIATDDPDVALTVDRVAVLVEGRLLQVGPSEEVYRDPFSPDVAAALGDVNLLEGDVRAKVLYSAIGPVHVEAAAGWAAAVLRPEDLDLEVVPRGDGRVVEVEYFGHGQRVAVLLDDGTPLRVRLHSRRRLTVGTRVRVRHTGPPPKVFSVRRAKMGAQ